MGKGGFRENSGRKKINREKQEFFEDAESYLLAVVRGETIPDAIRVAAAKCLISYTKAKQRAPTKSPAPSKLLELSERSVEKSIQEDFEAKAIKTREKLKLKREAKNDCEHKTHAGAV